MDTVILGKAKGRRVEAGHPWVYANEIEKVNGSPEAGAIVDVLNDKKQFIGRGYFNAVSQITVRILTRDKKEQVDIAFFRKKLEQCHAYRQKLKYTENYRLVFGEADFLPGLVIDKFGEFYVIQTLSAGMDKWKRVCADILLQDFHAAGVYERNDVPVRKLEGLEETAGFLSDPFPTKFMIDEYGVKFEVDVAEGQKTGFFLDQKENRLAIRNIVAGSDVLDCFTYTGSFALFARSFGAKSVTALDISEDALQLAVRNAALNGFGDIQFIAANAFDSLPEWVREGKQYDVVILDPPAFTKNRKGIENALKGYKEINLRGMKLVRPGGFLVTFSCSHFISVDLFYSMVASAAADAGKTIREIQYLSQAKDHPIVWGIDETHYLKGLILQVM